MGLTHKQSMKHGYRFNYANPRADLGDMVRRPPLFGLCVLEAACLLCVCVCVCVCRCMRHVVCQRLTNKCAA